MRAVLGGPSRPVDELRAYRVLGVAPTSSPPEIRTAYRLQVRRWHPDLFQNVPALLPKAEAAIKEINEAYRLIRAAPLSSIRRAGVQPRVPQSPPRRPAQSRTLKDWVYLARRLAALGNDQEAIRAYHEALRLAQRGRKPTAILWNNLGTVYYRCGQNRDAAQCFQRAIARRPGLSVPWFNLGLVAARFGDRNALRRIYSRLRALDPLRATELAVACHRARIQIGSNA